MSKNENPWPISLSLELGSSTNMHKTQNQLLPEGCHMRKVEAVLVCLCVIVCMPGLPVVPGLGSRNTNGRQLRPVALVGVNERDGGNKGGAKG